MDDLLSDGIGGVTRHMADDGELALAFHEGDQGTLVLFADDGVGFPVADAFLTIDDFRPMFYSDTIGDFAA